MSLLCFQCPECGLGHHEVGHLVTQDDIYCVVCLEEHGRPIRLHCWVEEADQDALRGTLLAA
jgi:hypothetical protein